MTTKTIPDIVRESGLPYVEALQLANLVKNTVLQEVSYRLWKFREEEADKHTSTYGAMNFLFKKLASMRGDPELNLLEMKVVYIAHPIGGNVAVNLAHLRTVVSQVNAYYPSVVPFVPYYSDCVSLDDSVPEQRARGIKNDIFIMRTGIVDEVWLTGGRVSVGMEAEVKLAKSLGIPVVDKLNVF